MTGSRDGVPVALDEATRLLAEQIEALDPRDMLPAPCCSSYCQIGTVFVPADGSSETDSFVPLTRYVDDQLWDTLSDMVDEGDYMELLAGTAAGEEWACETAGAVGSTSRAGSRGCSRRSFPSP